MDDSARERKAAEAAEAARNWRPAGWAVRDAAGELGVGVDSLLERYAPRHLPYPDPQRPGVYRVPLEGRADEAGEALVDAVDLPLIEGGECCLAGCASRDERGEGAFVAVRVRGEGKLSPLRRLILGVTGRGVNVRHANGDPLDCRRGNLVATTVSRRAMGAAKIKALRGRACSSRFKGVSWDKLSKKWRAAVATGGKRRELGRFDDEIAAARADDEAARELFGEHAYQNFPDGIDPLPAGESRQNEGGDDGETRAAA
jgi:hypothetical protein